jgi:hypothetical protein
MAESPRAEADPQEESRLERLFNIRRNTMIVTYNSEKKWYQFALNDTVYVIRLVPIGSYSQDILQAVFTSRNEPDGEPLATVTVATHEKIASDLKTESEDIQLRETQFLNAAKCCYRLA